MPCTCCAFAGIQFWIEIWLCFLMPDVNDTHVDHKCKAQFEFRFNISVRWQTEGERWRERERERVRERRATHDCSSLNKLWYATKTFNFLDKFDRRRRRRRWWWRRCRRRLHHPIGIEFDAPHIKPRTRTYYFQYALSAEYLLVFSIHFDAFHSPPAYVHSSSSREENKKKTTRESSPLLYLCTFFVLFCGKFHR